jgi:hypothetical protein
MELFSANGDQTSPTSSSFSVILARRGLSVGQPPSAASAEYHSLKTIRGWSGIASGTA